MGYIYCPKCGGNQKHCPCPTSKADMEKIAKDDLEQKYVPSNPTAPKIIPVATNGDAK